MALRWEGSYNRAMRELRLLQTERALANPNCHPPLADLQKIQQVAKRNGHSTAATPEAVENPQPQSDQQRAKRNPDPYPEAHRAAEQAPLCARSSKVGRNSPCPCGSTKKYKRCCGVDAPPILYAV